MQQRSELPAARCCARTVRGGGAFSSARSLPSRLSADNRSSLFESFIGTISRSDSSATCLRGVRLAPSPAGLCFATGVAEVSRFSCGEFAGVHGFPRPRRARAPLAKTRHAMWPSPFAHRVSARNSGFRGSLAGPPAPLSTLRPRRHRRRRMTRGQRGSLLLHCGALSSPTPRRFIPALSRNLSACRVAAAAGAQPFQQPQNQRQASILTRQPLNKGLRACQETPPTTTQLHGQGHISAGKQPKER